MRVVLEASLDHFTAGELLALIAARGRGGTLDATSGEKRARVFFRDGRVIGAEAAGTGSPESIVMDVAGWTDGAFRVLDAVVLPETVTPVSLEIGPLVAEGERRAAEERRLLQLYPNDDIEFTVNQQPKPHGTEVISLRPDEFQLLFLIGNGRKLAEIREQAGKPPLELYAALQRLQDAGLLSVSGAGAAAADPTVAQPIRRPTRKTRISEPKPKTSPDGKTLIATLTTETGALHPLLEEETTLGRDERNTIPIPHGSVSGRHARILRTPTGFSIEDLGSRNGTFVNSEPVTEKRNLADGEVVRLGKVLLTFNIAKETRSRDTTKPEVVR